MLFFRTISLVAALAFVTLSSAGPVDGDGLALSGDVFARDIDLSELALPVKRDGNVTVSFLYNNCKQNVQDIIVRIQVAIDTNNHGNIVDDLEEIVARLNLLIHSVQALGSKVALDIPVDEFCGILSSLVEIIVDVLVLVFKIGTDSDIKGCIEDVRKLLLTLLKATLETVAGITVTILEDILQPIEKALAILGLDFSDILKFLATLG